MFQFRRRARKKNPTPKTIRNRRSRDTRRQRLLDQLGNVCAECGTDKNLTFDHIHGRDWDVRAVHVSKRLRIYQEEADAGLIQLLCLSCNSRKGDPRASKVAADDEWDGTF